MTLKSARNTILMANNGVRLRLLTKAVEDRSIGSRVEVRHLMDSISVPSQKVVEDLAVSLSRFSDKGVVHAKEPVKPTRAR